MEETTMRDYVITKVRPGTYELDLYVNGSWVANKVGTKGEVEKYASAYINKRMPRTFRAIMS
jgi:outer membrane usher protein FimD/PapC